MRAGKRKNSWLTPALVLAGLIAMATPVAASSGSGSGNGRDKLDKPLKARAEQLGSSRVVLTVRPGQEDNATQEVRKLGGRVGRRLRLVSGFAIVLPNSAIKQLAERSEILSLHLDRPTESNLNRAAAAVGARAVREQYGYDGAGIGVAVIDSGITSYHDDFTYQGWSSKVRVVAGQRMTAFKDFVNSGLVAYDDNGHGTHVAGIIAGNGYDSYGARAGIAPAAHIVSLKVLDGQGRGVISDVIAAFEWAVANRTTHNIRVVNLSVGARITESHRTDPLTLAAKRAVDAGIVVVTAAGNFGKNAAGGVQYGGITAPGNAPWVLTVGASSTQGTASRYDDVMAGYSSRGPSAVDYEAKPDLVAPGTGMVSLSDATSEFYHTKSAFLLNGSRNTAYKPYLSLSGTSMAAPVVAGSVALMLQANPNLTPNLVKAILQYTAQRYQYDSLTQGAGFLNTEGAVRLARYFARARVGDRYPTSSLWSKQIQWGNRRLSGGAIMPTGSAWALNIVWGTAYAGENIVWGTLCGSGCENIVWGTLDSENIVWGTIQNTENIVWGTLYSGTNIVWGTLASVENIVWGTTGGAVENIVWGTACGGADCENIVWGTAMDLENIVWGTALDSENIVWGTASAGEGTTWASSGEELTLFDDPTAAPLAFDLSLQELFLPPPPPPDSTTGSTGTGAILGSVTGILGGGF